MTVEKDWASMYTKTGCSIKLASYQLVNERIAVIRFFQDATEQIENKEKKGKTTEKKSKKPLKGTTKPKVKKLTQVLVLEDSEENEVEKVQLPTQVVEEEKVVEQKEEIVPPVKKPRKPYTKKLVIGKETEIKDIQNIEEQPQPKKAKKAKSKNVNFIIEE